jgi:hypothetical protein
LMEIEIPSNVQVPSNKIKGYSLANEFNLHITPGRYVSSGIKVEIYV